MTAKWPRSRRKPTGVSGPPAKRGCSARGRRSACVLLCVVCVLVVCAGATYANGSARRARSAQSTGPMCCFLLTINLYEQVDSTYPAKSGNTPGQEGQYHYVMDGTASGLATLTPSRGARQVVYSTKGGVAEGFMNEDNKVTYEGQPFGCPSGNPQGLVKTIDFRRTRDMGPSYQPPPSLLDKVGNMDFGRPFDNLGPVCNSEFLDAANATDNALHRSDPQERLLTSFMGGPIHADSGLTVHGLLKGDHELKIDCYQQASVVDSLGRSYYTGVVIMIDIVHHSPDDEKHVLGTLKHLIGTYSPNDNPAESMLDKYDGSPGHTHDNGCTGSSA